MNVKVSLNKPKILKKVTNNNIGLFVSHEWHRLINPYTPRDKGALMNLLDEFGTVDELPFQLHYRVPYAAQMYEGIAPSGKKYEYRQINPHSTDHWDVKAAQAGQTDKLYRAINGYLRRS